MHDSVGCLYLSNIFINDLELEIDSYPSLFKYTNDSNISIPVLKNEASQMDQVGKFSCWTQEDKMKRNPENVLRGEKF